MGFLLSAGAQPVQSFLSRPGVSFTGSRSFTVCGLVRNEFPEVISGAAGDCNSVPSGVYLYRLTSDNFTTEKKIILLK